MNGSLSGKGMDAVLAILPYSAVGWIGTSMHSAGKYFTAG